MNSPRVLMITPDFPPALGGIQVVAHRLACSLSGFTLRVHTLGTTESDRLDDADGLDVRRTAQRRSHRLAVLELNAAAVREARRFDPDVILATHIAAAPACALIRRVLRRPVITYLHAREVPASPGLARLAVRTSARLIAVSRYTAELARRAGATSGQLTVIPPGVDLPATNATPRLPCPTVVTVARLTERYKGHDVMVRALPLVRARVPGAQWVVIGDGPLREPLMCLAQANGVADAVRLCGEVSDGERDRWLDGAHVFAMPSRVPAGERAGEGFGIVYLEAGAHGLPVVAGDGGGALDAVVHGETGMLVDATDHVAVADAIGDLLTAPAAAVRMGAAGRARAAEFGWPRIAGRVADVICEVAAG